MKTILKKKREELNKFGYCKVRIGSIKLLKEIKKKWISIFNNIAFKLYGIKIKNDADIIKLEKSKYKKIFVAVFDLIHMTPEIYKLASRNNILKIYKSLGIKFPHYGTRPITRIDLPNDKIHSFFDAHQDYPYNKHSKNSFVVWIPFLNVGFKEGCLEVSPRSHRLMKVFEQKKNSRLIKNVKKFNFLKIRVNLGEALVFSEFLVHRSGLNISKKIRFSLQLRVTDLLSKEYMKRYYPIVI